MAKLAMCPLCDKETDLEKNDGDCIHCGCPVETVLRRDKAEQALDKLRKKREETEPPTKKKKTGDIW